MLLVLLLTSFTLSAQTPRDDEPYCDGKAGKRLQITDADATILGFVIGHTSLKDIQAKLGKAAQAGLSSEEESDVFVCYVSPADGTVLAFYSGAMGGWTDITHFAFWSRKAAPARYSQCTPSKLVTRNLSTESRLRLGLTPKEVERIAGIPTKAARDSAKYEYTCRRKMTADELRRFKTRYEESIAAGYTYFDRLSWMDIGYANSRASHIEVGRTESY